MINLLNRFLRDENGDIVQNIGWLVAVSVGALVVGGLVYSGMHKYGTTTQNAVGNQAITPPVTPTYDGTYTGK